MMQNSDWREVLDRLARIETKQEEREQSRAERELARQRVILGLGERLDRLAAEVAAMRQDTRRHVVKATCIQGAKQGIQWASMGGGLVAVVVLFGKLLGYW